MNRTDAQIDTEGRPASNAVRVRDDRIRAEMWLNQHLHKRTGVDIYGGVTDPAERIRRLSALMTERGLAAQVLGRFNDKPETYSAFCRRALGITL